MFFFLFFISYPYDPLWRFSETIIMIRATELKIVPRLSKFHLLAHMYPSTWKRTFQKIHCMCHCYYCSGISTSQRERSSRKDNTHSGTFQTPRSLARTVNARAACFNLCNSARLVTSSFVQWKMARRVLPAFTSPLPSPPPSPCSFSGQPRSSRLFCLSRFIS